MKLREYEKLVLESMENQTNFEEYINENMPIIELSIEELTFSKNVKVEYIEKSTLEYLEEISNIPYPSDEDFENQEFDIENKEKLIEENLRLVSFLGMRMLKQGIDFMDLVQEGTITLIEGIEKFEKTPYIKLKDFLEVEILRKMIMSINSLLESKKVEFIRFFNSKNEEFQNDEELLEELRRKTKEVEDIDYFKLKNILLPIEIEVINRYYGLNGKKSSSMYEIEKEIELEKGKGEEIFQVAINKLSMFGSELFQI